MPRFPSVVTILCVFALLVLAGCGTPAPEGPGLVTDLSTKSLGVRPGTSSATVLKILGSPAQLSFSGTREAWSYCENLPPAAMTFRRYRGSYITVWIDKDIVHRMTTYTKYNDMSCHEGFKEVDWGQVPSNFEADININTNE